MYFLVKIIYKHFTFLNHKNKISLVYLDSKLVMCI